MSKKTFVFGFFKLMVEQAMLLEKHDNALYLSQNLNTNSHTLSLNDDSN